MWVQQAACVVISYLIRLNQSETRVVTALAIVFILLPSRFHQIFQLSPSYFGGLGKFPVSRNVITELTTQ